MQFLPQILFVILITVSIFLFTKRALEIKRNILLGRDENLNDHKSIRLKNVLLLAFGQKKMFKNPLVAILHFFVYAGFIIINIEILEIVLDGILGTHRLFLPYTSAIYNYLINAFEFLAAAVLISCVIFFIRRNTLHIKRFISKDLKGWPKSDANYILITEIVLMSLFLIMNTTDQILQSAQTNHYSETGNFYISSLLMPLFQNLSISSLVIIERTCWWLHIIGIFAFLNYLPYSKHLHIILAFPNAYYSRLNVQGKMNNMPAIQQEVLYAMQPELIPTEPDTAEVKKFGAKDVFDLSWKNLLDSYTCTECGRCSAACPANSTGKLLSPRKIMMDTRDRITEVGKNIQKNGSFIDDNKSLLRDYISEEELRACTTCNACVEACPVSINPLDIIFQLRRYLIMEESNAPQEWNSMFSSIENNFAPWKLSPDERNKWTEEIN
jgi:heterodisulfide reductase subunit C